ncbi:hypothetical protein L9F63_028123, partial [Diploptera punctata]
SQNINSEGNVDNITNISSNTTQPLLKKEMSFSRLRNNRKTKLISKIEGSKIYTLKKRDKRDFYNECDNGFGTLSDLTRHLQIYAGEKGFSCQFCGKDLVMKESLRAHYKLHPGEKPYFNRWNSNLIREETQPKHSSIYSCQMTFQISIT